MFGICASMDERFSEAEEVFELAVKIDSQNIIAWTVRGDEQSFSFGILVCNACVHVCDG